MAEYFSHDYHARTDPRLLRLRMKYGLEGIGIYWCIIEMLYESGGKIKLSECDRIAYELQTQCERIIEIIKTDLFVCDETYFWSESVFKRLKMRLERSQKAKASAKTRWSNNSNKEIKNNNLNNEDTTHECECIANALQTHYDSNAIKEKKIKENKRKENNTDHPFIVNSNNDINFINNKENKINSVNIVDENFSDEKQTVFKRTNKQTKKIIIPTEEEFVEYFKTNGYKIDIALRAYKGYSEANWKDSRGKPVLNWKQKCQHVWFKDEHRNRIKSKEQQIEECEKTIEQYRKEGWNVV